MGTLTAEAKDKPGVGATIGATLDAEGEEETASIKETAVRCASSEKLDARIAFGGRSNSVTLAVGFDRVADGATTPAGAATRTASGGATAAAGGA